MDDVNSLVGAVLRLASLQAAVENLEISQLDMQAAFLKGLLTSIPMKPLPRIAENSEITCPTDNIVWTGQEMLERLVDVVEEMVFRRCGDSVIVVQLEESHSH